MLRLPAQRDAEAFGRDHDREIMPPIGTELESRLIYNPCVQQLLHYRLIDKIGVGGMGEVWRATDTTLGREVAIKILPAAFAADPERLVRFEREARLLASLNHPNIATVHGFHEADGKRFLAMELVPGVDLAERLRSGALPMREALDVARQTAEALEAAHEQGVVHRDLKPANVKLTPDGRVKVLDFGLAKASDIANVVSSTDAGLSPTITSLGTVAGVIIGTAAYMSPEQARGKPVDKRADVWAFGCVLFEMLSAKRPFDGETVSDTLAAVLAKDPDWSLIPAATPARVRDLLLRCLEKDTKRRLRDIGEARIELENALANRTPSEPVKVVRDAMSRRSPLALGMTALAVIATLVAGWALTRPAPASAPARLMRLRVERPPGESVTGPGYFSLSPDGTAVVFTVSGGTASTHLWIRELSDGAGHDLPGTEGAIFPFWSPDSRTIAFFADAKMKKMPRGGGAIQTVCEAPNGRGGTWSPSGMIVFAPAPFSALMKVAHDGGVPQPATKLEAAKKQSSHRFPSFLPDGTRFIYGVTPAVQPSLMQVEIASLDDPVGRPLLLGRNVARYVAPGYMLFPRDQGLVAQRFDAKTGTMSGDIIPLADRADVVERVVGSPAVSTADNGTVVYDEPDRRATEGLWFSRDGRPLGTAFRHQGRVFNAAMSRAGDRVFVGSLKEAGSAGTVVNLSDGTETRIVREDRMLRYAVWSARDDRLVVNLFENGDAVIVSIDPRGGSERVVFNQRNRWTAVTSTGPDGTVVFDDPFSGPLNDIVYLPGGSGDQTKTYLSTPANERGAELSWDGRFAAYASDASGRDELYVDSFPQPSDPKRVSMDGAAADAIAWRRDGRELYFTSADGRQLLACDLTTTPTLSVGKPHVLFTLPQEVFGVRAYPDGSKFLVMVPVGEPRTSLTLVQNWSAQLQR